MSGTSGTEAFIERWADVTAGELQTDDLDAAALAAYG